MENNSFGRRLKEIRASKRPKISQELLAERIDRTKVTVSQFETGKNNPPDGPLLEKLIDALGATDEEAKELRFLSAYQRNAIPNDIECYFYAYTSIYDAVVAGKEAGFDEADWQEITDEIRNRNGRK